MVYSSSESVYPVIYFIYISSALKFKPFYYKSFCYSGEHYILHYKVLAYLSGDWCCVGAYSGWALRHGFNMIQDPNIMAGVVKKKLFFFLYIKNRFFSVLFFSFFICFFFYFFSFFLFFQGFHRADHVSSPKNITLYIPEHINLPHIMY